MARRKHYRSRRAFLGALAAELRDEGWSWGAIAARIQREEHVGALAAMRLARGWTQQAAADVWNELFPDSEHPMTMKKLSFWETWPHSGRQPSLTVLGRLADVYECDIKDLVDSKQPSSWAHGLKIPITPVWLKQPAPADPTAARTLERQAAEDAEVVETKRRDAVKLTGLAVAAPACTAQILDQAAADATEFSEQAQASALGSGTLEHLDRVVSEFGRVTAQKPPREVFEAAFDYRRKVALLLAARHTHREGRELVAYAARLSELLAWLANDLGDTRAGLAFANDALVHGQQAGHGEQIAYAMDVATSLNLYAQRPEKALAAARKGLAEAPADRPVTVVLHAQAARAAAACGDADGFAAALRAAEEAYDRLPARPALRFGKDVLPQADYTLHSYPATSCVWLGQAEQARRYAEQALAIMEAGPESSSRATRQAIARIDLALAEARLGNADDAVALGHQALDYRTSPRVTSPVRRRADDLVTFLRRRYPRQTAVEGLRERLATAQETARATRV
ncbi:hypothetical protein RKE29_20540 [Streptomyces sp. B1866]|uniref:hypothetical protein n=1 Tax=Streptomyces sp. B1866 TaxID=3075431 RepID=UPI002891329A|nr:hypothetical protein [Streptomyces sp. B1866]MDT3399002.1 hypothetical protein [Streptomyces sp. B1866]